MPYKKPNVKAMQAECDAFNAENPVGAQVWIRLDGEDEPMLTVTRSEAQILSGHSTVIWLEGVTGCYLLDRVTPVPAMNISSASVTMLTITDMKGLDPIRVITEDYYPGAGRIIITCWDRAWAGYWGGMSGRSVSEFFIRSDAGYLLSNLMCGSGLKRTKHDDTYLIRIIEAVQAALRKQAEKSSVAVEDEAQKCLA